MAENSSVNQTGAGLEWPYVDEGALVRIVRLICEAAIALFGLVWNILVCAIVARQTKQSYIKFYIINLAVADIGVLCLSFPLAVVREQLPLRWPLGREVCLMLYPLADVFYGVSVWSITAIAFERRRNIVRRFVSMRRSTNRSSKSVRWILLGIWLVSFFTVAFPLFFVMDYQENVHGTVCLVTWSRLLHACYVVFLSVFFYAFPLVIITITYIQISHRIHQSNKFHHSMQRTQSDPPCSTLRCLDETTQMKRNATTKRFLTPVALVFLFTFLPLNALRLVLLFWRDFALNKYFFVLFNVCVVGTIVNSAANPLIYSIVCQEFRTDLKKLIARCLPCWVRSSFQDDSTQLVTMVPIIPNGPPADVSEVPALYEERPDASDRCPIMSVQTPTEPTSMTSVA